MDSVADKGVKTVTIVLVEDDMEQADVVLAVLETLQPETCALRILHCSTVKTSLPQLSQAQILLLDYNLPDGTGMDIMNSLDAQEIRPYIIVTSSQKAPAAALMARGGNKLIQKPFAPSRLLEAVSHALSLL